jgi:autoinducer 2-degrading protein
MPQVGERVMTLHAVTVAFRLHPGGAEAFLGLVRENARVSLAEEPGCRRFDVCLPTGGDGLSVFLYELYEDPAAFDAHLATPHFRAFDAATRAMVADKRVETYATEPAG